MKPKERILLVLICVTFLLIVLYEAGIVNIELSNNLYAENDQNPLVLIRNDETVTLQPGTKLNIVFNSGENGLEKTGVIEYTMMDELYVYGMKVNNTISVPIDEIQMIYVAKGSRAGKYAGRGFWIGGVTGAVWGVSATQSVWGALCGLPIGGLGAAIGGISGAMVRDKSSYPVNGGEWEISSI